MSERWRLLQAVPSLAGVGCRLARVRQHALKEAWRGHRGMTGTKRVHFGPVLLGWPTGWTSSRAPTSPLRLSPGSSLSNTSLDRRGRQRRGNRSAVHKIDVTFPPVPPALWPLPPWRPRRVGVDLEELGVSSCQKCPWGSSVGAAALQPRSIGAHRYRTLKCHVVLAVVMHAI